MKTYTVLVSIELEVEAENEQGAKDQAMEDIFDIEVGSFDYGVVK